MPRLTKKRDGHVDVALPPAEWKKLAALSERQFRTIRQQATELLVSALNRQGKTE